MPLASVSVSVPDEAIVYPMPTGEVHEFAHQARELARWRGAIMYLGMSGVLSRQARSAHRSASWHIEFTFQQPHPCLHDNQRERERRRPCNVKETPRLHDLDKHHTVRGQAVEPPSSQPFASSPSPAKQALNFTSRVRQSCWLSTLAPRVASSALAVG